jgi:hypothetical protein
MNIFGSIVSYRVVSAGLASCINSRSAHRADVTASKVEPDGSLDGLAMGLAIKITFFPCTNGAYLH